MDTGLRNIIQPSAEIILVLIISLILTFPAHSQTQSGQLLLLSPETVESGPRSVVTLSVRLTNIDTDRNTFTIEAETPEGWSYIAMPDSLELEPEGSGISFISLTVPSDVLSGENIIRVNAFPQDDPGDVASTVVMVRIPEVVRLDVSTDRPVLPEIYTGDQIEVVFTVSNYGNAPTRVIVEFTSRQDWPINTDPADLEFELSTNESRRITATVSVPEEIVRSVLYLMTCRVQSLEPGMEDLVAEARISTRVITRQLSGASMYSTLYSRLHMGTSLSEGGEYRMRLVLRSVESEFMEGRRIWLGPVNLLNFGDSNGSLVSSGRFSIHYDEDDMYFRGGDFSLDLNSPLLGRRISGRGGELFFKLNDSSYRALYSRTRGSSQRDNTGLQFGYGIDDSSSMLLTVIRDEPVNQTTGSSVSRGSSTLYGIFYEYSPSDSFNVTGEYGNSANSEGLDGANDAWRLSGKYRGDFFTLNCEWLRAGGGFHGGWTDTDQRRLNLSWSVTDDIDLLGSYYLSRNNIEADFSEEARRLQNIGFGISWDIEDVGLLRVTRLTTRREDVFLGNYNDNIRTTGYSLTRTWGDLFLMAAYIDQSTEDRLNGLVENNRLFRLSTSVNITRELSARLGYTARLVRAPGVDDNNSRDLNLDCRYRATDDMDFSLDLTRSFNTTQGRRTTIHGAIQWELDDGSSIDFRIRSYLGSLDSDTEIGLEYIYPFSIPLRAFPRRGNIEGRMFMEAAPDQGIQGVVLKTAGNDVVTDENGYFRFPGLDPGEHEIQMDWASLAVGLSPDLNLPIIVNVEPGGNTWIEIPVIESVSIRGQVLRTVRRADPEPVLQMAIQLEGSTLDQPKYRWTDDYGRFVFADLRPGTYTVSIMEGYLPEWTEVTSASSFDIELAPGDVFEDAEFVIGSVSREIEITTEMPSSN